jgi:hypothetical protein
MKTRLISRLALVSLLATAALTSEAVLADQPTPNAPMTATGQQQFHESSLEMACWRHHHHYRHCRHYRHHH